MTIRYKSVYEMSRLEALTAIGEITIRRLEYDERRVAGIPSTEEEEEQIRSDAEFAASDQEMYVRMGKKVADNPVARGAEKLLKMAKMMDKMDRESN